MPELNGTKTRENLLRAFAGESQARNRYTYFAGVAKKEGYQAVGMIFDETANHEKEHAKRIFKFLDGGPLEITYTYPAGKIGTTLENLAESAAGEHEESSIMYPEFSKIAREEGFNNIAEAFDSIALAEVYHEKRYNKLIEDIKNGALLKKNSSMIWKCQNCGYHFDGLEAPAACPACAHAQGYFIELNDLIF